MDPPSPDQAGFAFFSRRIAGRGSRTSGKITGEALSGLR
jgi:hypothetical protein